jgi:hypothetical protein
MRRQQKTRTRQVFKKQPSSGRWQRAASGVLLIALGCGLLVALMQLPERLDTLLLVSTAIANLISGLSSFLLGLLQLLAVLLLVIVAIGALVLLLAGLSRLVRACLAAPPPPSRRRRSDARPRKG